MSLSSRYIDIGITYGVHIVNIVLWKLTNSEIWLNLSETEIKEFENLYRFLKLLKQDGLTTYLHYFLHIKVVSQFLFYSHFPQSINHA